jgi:hypothetical protein
MAWKMNCLLCAPGSAWHPPRPRCATEDLVAIQEHLMAAHGINPDALRSQERVALAPDHYHFRVWDGSRWQTWLDAWKVSPPPPARRVGPVPKAALCAHCGAQVPNSWTDPRKAVQVGETVYCDETCEARANARPAPRTQARED